MPEGSAGTSGAGGPGTPGRRGGGARWAVVVALVLGVVGVVALVVGLRGTSPDAGASAPSPPAAASTPLPGTPPASTTRPDASASGDAPTGDASSALGQFLPASAPTRLRIRSIGVDSTQFVPLHVQADGSLSVPATADQVGEYAAGPGPGQLGPAVLAAHVDTPSGRRGLFWRLGDVRPRDTVEVSRADGTRLTFAVDRVESFRKATFPTDLVYKGGFDRAEIRLVTCGGPVDARNEYRDNVVVFGHLTSVADAG